MKTMYRVQGWGNQIEKLEVIKTSEKSVWFATSRGNESRELKETSYQKWFESKNEAKDFLVNKLNKDVASAEWKLKKAKAELESLLKEFENEIS